MSAGKKGKREAADKPAVKETAKKPRKEKAPKKEADAAAAGAAAELEQAPATDVEMKEEPSIVGSGRVAAQVCVLLALDIHRAGCGYGIGGQLQSGTDATCIN